MHRKRGCAVNLLDSNCTTLPGVARTHYAAAGNLQIVAKDLTRNRYFEVMKRPPLTTLHQITSAKLASAAVIAVAVITIADIFGWLLGIPILKSLVPGFMPMRMVTAITLLFSVVATAGISDAVHPRWKRPLFLIGCSVAGMLSLLMIAIYIVDIVMEQSLPLTNYFGLFALLNPDVRMPVVTAVLLFHYVAVVILLNSRNPRLADFGHGLLLPISMVSYLVILGYFFGIRELFVWRGVTVAFNTSIAVFGLCLAAFCIRPRSWLMNVFTSEGAGADMARRLLPVILILPLLIGWSRLQGERYGIFGSEVGVALVAVTYTLCFLLLLWMNTRAVNHTDRLRRAAEAVLEKSEKMLSRAEGIAHLGSWELDAANQRLYWSDESYRIFGFEPQAFEATYQTFLDIIHPDDRAAVDAAYVTSVRDGCNTYEIEHRIIQKSTGDMRFVHQKCDHERDAAGKLLRSTGMVHDITERKQTEKELTRAKTELEQRVRIKTADLSNTLEALEKERQRFNDVLDVLPTYVVLLTKDYHISFANQCFREKFGEPARKRCYEILFDRNEPCIVCESFKPFSSHAPHQWEWTGPDCRIYDIFDFPFSDVDGSPLILEMGIDITDHKKAEIALLESKELKVLGQLTSGVAHEVRNPLNGILAIMGALSKELSDEERFKPYLQHMRNQVTRLTVLMEDLLVLSRPLRKDNLLEISMVQLVENTLATWLPTLASPAPTVRIVSPPDHNRFLIRVEVTSMMQVIINLLENAFNHSPPEMEITCTVREQYPDEIVLSIRDQGTGIPAEILPKIFDPFFTTRKGGTGLGLSIVRRVVDNHGGRVSACNNSDGAGATFEIALPRSTPTPETNVAKQCITLESQAS
jgi:PAS domain S-box-containing protein